MKYKKYVYHHLIDGVKVSKGKFVYELQYCFMVSDESGAYSDWKATLRKYNCIKKWNGSKSFIFDGKEYKIIREEI